MRGPPGTPSPEKHLLYGESGAGDESPTVSSQPAIRNPDDIVLDLTKVAQKQHQQEWRSERYQRGIRWVSAPGKPEDNCNTQ